MEQVDRYAAAWTRTMQQIWRERMARLRINDTGQLARSVQGLTQPGEPMTIELAFLKYGVYVAKGVGRNYKKSKQANGTVPFLLPGGEQYRKDNRLDSPRRIGPAWHRSRNSQGNASNHEAGGRPMKYDPTTGRYTERDWYGRAFYTSRLNLASALAAIYRQAFEGIVTKMDGTTV